MFGRIDSNNKTIVPSNRALVRAGTAVLAVLSVAVLAGCSSSAPKPSVLGTSIETPTTPTTVAVADAPPAVVAATAWPALTVGAKSPQVMALQYLLKAQGVTVSADGGFGKKTGKAVSDFQTKQKLTVSGNTDEATWAALATDITAKSPANAIRGLQAALRTKEPTLKLSGSLDQATKDALNKARAAAGIPTQDADVTATKADWQMLLAAQ
jgi:peptidoglycan hydrolase-like protein with peptidoglycan-binding domain